MLASSNLSTGLLLVHLDDIILFHLESLRGLVIVDPSSIEQKPKNKQIRELIGI